MGSPDDRRYTQTHEWHKLEGDNVVIGLTRFAVDELTDITYVDITNRNGSIQAGDSFGEIESVKATSDLYCGVDGTVVDVNQEAIDHPEVVNADPFGKGWLIKVAAGDPGQLEGMMTADAYDKAHPSG